MLHIVINLRTRPIHLTTFWVNFRVLFNPTLIDRVNKINKQQFALIWPLKSPIFYQIMTVCLYVCMTRKFRTFIKKGMVGSEFYWNKEWSFNIQGFFWWHPFDSSSIFIYCWGDQDAAFLLVRFKNVSDKGSSL